MNLMSRLLNYFFKGVVLLAPLAFTVYVCVRVFATIDGWLGIPIPGVGFLATVVLITLFGFLASSFLTRRMLSIVEGVLERLPFVRLLYSSTKDLLNAFVGEKRRFDKPVLVAPFASGEARALGFGLLALRDVAQVHHHRAHARLVEQVLPRELDPAVRAVLVQPPRLVDRPLSPPAKQPPPARRP